MLWPLYLFPTLVLFLKLLGYIHSWEIFILSFWFTHVQYAAIVGISDMAEVYFRRFGHGFKVVDQNTELIMQRLEKLEKAILENQSQNVIQNNNQNVSDSNSLTKIENMLSNLEMKVSLFTRSSKSNE